MTGMAARVASLRVAVLAACIAASTSACSGIGKDASDEALRQAQASYEAIKADAKRYLPEQATLIEEAYDSVKNDLAHGEFMKGLKGAQALDGKIGELRTVLETKKAALEKSWQDIDASVPTSVEALQKRLDELERSGKLPANISKETVAAAKAAIPVVRAKWDDALAAAKSADWKAAIDTAVAVKMKAGELLTSLGITMPEGGEPSSAKK